MEHEIEWKDLRLEKPRCNSYSKYLVIQKFYNGFKVDVCAWIPTEHYTNGFWATLGHGSIYGQDPFNLKTDDVLYWAEFPAVPSVIKLIPVPKKDEREHL